MLEHLSNLANSYARLAGLLKGKMTGVEIEIGAVLRALDRGDLDDVRRHLLAVQENASASAKLEVEDLTLAVAA